MVMYEYGCSSCGIVYELMKAIEDRDSPLETPCPSCGSSYGIHRIVGNRGGFRLSPHGSVGWAEDGYSSTYGDAENFKAGRRVY